MNKGGDFLFLGALYALMGLIAVSVVCTAAVKIAEILVNGACFG